jgi:hypothetical protein
MRMRTIILAEPLDALGRSVETFARHKEAVRINSAFPEGGSNLAKMPMTKGDFEEGKRTAGCLVDSGVRRQAWSYR